MMITYYTQNLFILQKAIVTKETKTWNGLLSGPHTASMSLVGVEWPDDANVNVDGSTGQADNNNEEKTVEIDGKNYYPNCYPVPWIRDYWSPKLNKALTNHVGFRV